VPAQTRNWKALDVAHRRRGTLITVVFDIDGQALARPGPQGKRGRSYLYNDALNEGLLLDKVVLRLSLRALEGFAHGLARTARAEGEQEAGTGGGKPGRQFTWWPACRQARCGRWCVRPLPVPHPIHNFIVGFQTADCFDETCLVR
jgi:hypothetical protein